MPHGKKAASKTPMDAYADGCRATSISTAYPTGKSRRSSSPPTSPPVNASGSRRHSKPCLPSLERMCKSTSLNLVALRSGIQGGHVRVAYNSCRNRHCPRCQGAAARAWLAEREADLLPIGYFHVVFELCGKVGDGVNQAADLISATASIPSLNFI